MKDFYPNFAKTRDYFKKFQNFNYEFFKKDKIDFH